MLHTCHITEVEMWNVVLFHSFYAIENENVVIQFVLTVWVSTFILFDICSNQGKWQHLTCVNSFYNCVKVRKVMADCAVKDAIIYLGEICIVITFKVVRNVITHVWFLTNPCTFWLQKKLTENQEFYYNEFVWQPVYYFFWIFKNLYVAETKNGSIVSSASSCWEAGL